MPWPRRGGGGDEAEASIATGAVACPGVGYDGASDGEGVRCGRDAAASASVAMEVARGEEVGGGGEVGGGRGGNGEAGAGDRVEPARG